MVIWHFGILVHYKGHFGILNSDSLPFLPFNDILLFKVFNISLSWNMLLKHVIIIFALANKTFFLLKCLKMLSVP